MAEKTKAKTSTRKPGEFVGTYIPFRPGKQLGQQLHEHANRVGESISSVVRQFCRDGLSRAYPIGDSKRSWSD